MIRFWMISLLVGFAVLPHKANAKEFFNCGLSLVHMEELRENIRKQVRKNGLDSFPLISERGVFSQVRKFELGYLELALKIPKSQSLNAFTLREFSNLSQFQHDNIVQPITVLELEEKNVLVLPYLGDQTLRDSVVYRKLSKSLGERKRILETILSVLSYLHSNGYFAEDFLNLENIMMFDGIPIFIDFADLQKRRRESLEVYFDVQLKAVGVFGFKLLTNRLDILDGEDWRAYDYSSYKLDEDIEKSLLPDRIKNILISMIRVRESKISAVDAYVELKRVSDLGPYDSDNDPNKWRSQIE